MDEKLLHRLQAITPEEQAILAGRTTIDRTLYMLEGKDRIHAEKLLEKGKLITLRTGTRFIDFPDHTHDYVEVVYMCAGSATHIVDGREIHLRQGELLLLSQRAVHAVRRAELSDVSVNFIVLPDFFNTTLSVLGREESPLRRFLVDCLCGEKTGPGYLHFGVSGVKTIENLVENLIYTLLEDKQNPEKTSQLTMALLFLQLTEYAGSVHAPEPQQSAVLKALRYVETDYAQGNFQTLCTLLCCEPSWLSRQIKAGTGKTFTQLQQEKRLSQAAFLLKNTKTNIAEISVTVGYENISFFHRLFRKSYGCSPKAYREEN